MGTDNRPVAVDVELRHPRHRARPRELPALRRRHGGRGRAHRGAARGARALRQRRGRRREPPPARLGRRGRGRQDPGRRGGRPLAADRAPIPISAWPPPRSPRCCRRPGVELRNCLGRWIPRGTRLGLRAALPPSAEVWVVAVGRGAWVAIPGEPYTRLGLEIKAAGRASFAHDLRRRGRPTPTRATSWPPSTSGRRATSRAAASTGSAAGSWCATRRSRACGSWRSGAQPRPVKPGR